MEAHREKRVKIFTSFADENRYEEERRQKMTVEDRIKEFAVIQERRWGGGWRSRPIVKKVTFEKISK